MAKIFINYRRKDSAPYAGRLYDRLVGHFGPDHVFMDIDQIEPGEVFDNVIQEKLKAVQAAVVLIGANWLDIAAANGQRRLDDPDDWVRLEIAALLERNIRVIPVLVGGAALPKSTQLPECLVPLTRRQAIEITDQRFHADADKLIKALEKIMGVPAPKQLEPPEKPKEPEKPGLSRFVAIAGVTGIVVAAGVYFMPPKPTLVQPETEYQTITAPATEQPQQKIPEPTAQPVTEQPKAAIIEPDMVRIPSGKFLMGSPETEADRASDEGPQHEVTISKPFALSRHEITVGQFRQFVEDAGYRTTAEQSGKGCYVWNADKKEVEQLPERNWKNPGFKQNDNHPAVCVSWDDAQAYIGWLSDRSDKRYRLPTEAEWEYAARAGSQTRYWWGDDIGQNNAVCDGCGSEGDDKQTAPVGSFKPNTFGLHDTAGNVWEWTQDCWHDDYDKAPRDGSAWLEKGGGDCSRRVVRGGSWYDIPQYLRSADRGWNNADVAGSSQGFRIARDF